MILLAMILASAVTGGTRTLLLILVIIAMALIITGAVIAAMTWMNMRKGWAMQTGAVLLESEHF